MRETTADYSLELAMEHIRKATENISEIVIDKVWGSENFSEEYKGKLLKAMFQLVEMENFLR